MQRCALQGRDQTAKDNSLLQAGYGWGKSKVLGLVMSVYNALFYIMEEKRFVRWDEYIEYYRNQGVEDK